MKDNTTLEMLIFELLQMAETSEAYKTGQQWAVNAVATARTIVDHG